MERSFSEIRAKVDRGEAVVLTAREVGEVLADGGRVSLEEVDVVTCATRAVMSGTYAVLSFPAAPPAPSGGRSGSRSTASRESSGPAPTSGWGSST
ncbi:homocysteine biosynthesis protein [Methanothrix harundinacea]|uniref:Putative methanogenesis marker 16 metalloprotein n=1 Tax=Methanothrix harundinacea (strain 6Ac) TaxID=1110509 RepID=G7WMK0_METH6|nr:homocysteine biosynthesis protein [Methanothrix harundinacea]AET64495.1 Putative methanogenesis marker 16 metalloprotein [Methanothrix harundinacea 6Ac]